VKHALIIATLLLGACDEPAPMTDTARAELICEAFLACSGSEWTPGGMTWCTQSNTMSPMSDACAYAIASADCTELAQDLPAPCYAD
jgi:hypothetical protein